MSIKTKYFNSRINFLTCVFISLVTCMFFNSCKNEPKVSNAQEAKIEKTVTAEQDHDKSLKTTSTNKTTEKRSNNSDNNHSNIKSVSRHAALAMSYVNVLMLPSDNIGASENPLMTCVNQIRNYRYTEARNCLANN